MRALLSPSARRSSASCRSAARLRVRQRQAGSLRGILQRPDARAVRPLQARARDDRGRRIVAEPRYYCLTAHGAAVARLSGDPTLGELMVMNYRAAKLTRKQRAMLDFSVKMTQKPARSRTTTARRCAASASRIATSGTSRRYHGLLQHVEPWRARPTCGRTRPAGRSRPFAGAPRHHLRASAWLKPGYSSTRLTASLPPWPPRCGSTKFGRRPEHSPALSSPP